MPDAPLYDVFLSHSAKDKAVVRRIAERLRADGLRVWFDEWEVKPADSIPAKIEEGLEHSRVLVLCMSVNAFGSDWAQLESGTFRFRDPLNKERRFLPLRLDDAPLKGSLAQFLPLDWRTKARKAEYPKLLEACRPAQNKLNPEESADGERLAEKTYSLGHTAGVKSVAWSPDGTRALSGADDNTVRLWDAESGRCLRVFEGHTDGVRSVAWSADGESALSGSVDNTVRLWEVESGRCRCAFEGHTGRVWSVTWTADGKRALSGAQDRTVRLWDVETGRCLRVLEGHTGRVLSVACSADGKSVLSGADDKTVRLWDVETGQCQRVFEGHTNNVFSVAWSADGKRVFSGSADSTVRLWKVESGDCERVFGGHTASVLSVAWSVGGKSALSGADDNTVRLWEVETGRCVRVFEGHTSSVWNVAWSPDEKSALSGSADNTVRLWDVESGRCLRIFEGHTSKVFSVSWSADGKSVLSGSADKTVRLWKVETGRCLRVLEGHTARVLSVAWSADGKSVLSGSVDNTVRLWKVESGRCQHVFEGHSDNVLSVAWSADGKRALSGSADKTVRLWGVESGRCQHVFEGHSDSVLSVSWSPDGRCALSAAVNGVWREWDMEVAATSPAAAPDQVQYSNAKVLLVGDSGVGKSGLAERLVHNRFVATKSSHARKVHVLENSIVEVQGSVPLQRETVLWDLAGQPAFRLVHQLSMDDAALACVLFDCRSETNRFEGAAYWSQVLDQARTSTKLKKILVASRIDVGGLPASKERIEAFAREHGFANYIFTSANTGEGCGELLDAIRAGIPWGDLPVVTTTNTLAAMRDYVARLRGQKDGVDRPACEGSVLDLLSIAALHEGFAAFSGEKIPLSEFIAHLQRLEATDAVDLLVFHTTGAEPRQEDLVLLDPTRVDAYASALLVAAKDEPDGPGHLLELRVRDGDFKLDAEERLCDRDSERHLLWFVIENLLARDLALRERIKGDDYVVFPSQCTAELTFPGVAAFGVGFGFAGPVRSIYATLIAQLAHYEGFTKREFFKDAAAYRARAGGRCLVRLHDLGRGRGELEISFEGEAPASVRDGFLEFVGNHLESKSRLGSVTKRHAYHCANATCRNAFEDRVVKARLEAGRKNLLCPICEETTPLVDLLAAPSAAAESVAAQIGTDAKAGRQRMTAAFVIKAKETEGKFDIFLSHNSKDKLAVEKIANRLLKVGIRPWLDKWQLPPGARLSRHLETAIETIPCAALCFGPGDVGRWHIMEIDAYVERWAAKDARMIPLLLPGVLKQPDLPLFVRQALWVDMSDWEAPESDSFDRLVCGILGKAPGNSPMKKFGARDVAEWQAINR